MGSWASLDMVLRGVIRVRHFVVCIIKAITVLKIDDFPILKVTACDLRLDLVFNFVCAGDLWRALCIPGWFFRFHKL